MSPSEHSAHDAPMEDWGRLRRLVYRALHAKVRSLPAYDLFMATVVVVNIVVMAIESNNGAECVMSRACGEKLWSRVMNEVFLGLYCLDCVAQFFVKRTAYFRELWNWLDLFVVVLGLLQPLFVEADLGHVNMLRMFRVFRVIRVLKVLRKLPTLWSLVSGLIGALEAMAYGLILVMVLVFLWSIVSVEILHPIAWDVHHEAPGWCRTAFSTTWNATLYLFVTLVAGDNFSQCAIPIILEEPWTWIIFAMSLVTIQLGFLNLVLAVIVDKAAESREVSKEDRLEQQRLAKSTSLHNWVEVMKTLDTDGSGTVTLEELLMGYEDEVVKDMLFDMGIEEGDLRLMFGLLDTDDSGTLGYDEFIGALLKAQVQDPKVSMLIMQLRVQKIQYAVYDRLDRYFADGGNRSSVVRSSAIPPKDGVDDSSCAGAESEFGRASAHIVDILAGAPECDKDSAGAQEVARPSSPASAPGYAKAFGEELRAFSEALDGRLAAAEARSARAMAELSTALRDLREHRRADAALPPGDPQKPCTAVHDVHERLRSEMAPPPGKVEKPCTAAAAKLRHPVMSASPPRYRHNLVLSKPGPRYGSAEPEQLFGPNRRLRSRVPPRLTSDSSEKVTRGGEVRCV